MTKENKISKENKENKVSRGKRGRRRKHKFQSKRLGAVEKYRSYYDVVKDIFSPSNMTRFAVLVVCISLVLYFWRTLLFAAQSVGSFLGKEVVATVSDRWWVDMKSDELGNVNILLLGHGWGKHSWGFLADSIIVVSWNQKLWAITMLSVPRDLYINDAEHKVKGKINKLFASIYYRTKDFGEIEDETKKEELKVAHAADVMSSKLEEITGLEIPYYAVIDFEEFEALIDNLGGVTVDVPKRLYDAAYPQGLAYTVFKVEKWVQTFDGATALRYARSRHSTSDFARSARQQQIIKAIIASALSKENMTNISKLTSLYQDYSKMMFTNITKSEIIWIMKYADNIEHIFAFNYTTRRSSKDYKQTEAGSFLVTPKKELFWWASVILPKGASPYNVSFYDYTQNFAFYVAHNQKYLIENPRIKIENGIDPKAAKKLRRTAKGHAGQMAVKLTKFGFNIEDIASSDEYIEKTTVLLASTGIQYDATIQTLKDGFISIEEIQTNQDLGTGVDMVVVLGLDYLEKMGTKKFSYDK